MVEFDQREYQMVILAALLHDVGHEEASLIFIETFQDKLRNDELYWQSVERESRVFLVTVFCNENVNPSYAFLIVKG